ncbi:MAG: T9SS type A sorting domain-containing protein [Bacteroidales bacterium]|nr:T9SS type A sorting domain-containing protein [Bacteroidales bacterium]
MRTLIILFINILFCQTVLSQYKVDAYFGISNRSEWAREILELYDKGYYISGGFEGYGEYNNGWNIKTDINLELIYDKTLEHDLSTVAQRASVSDENENIYITGFTTYPEKWPFVTKIDSCGNKVWCKILQYDDEFEDGSGRDILISDNNEIILLADFDSEEEIDKVHLVGLNENGDVLWITPDASKNDYPWIREQNGGSLTEINNNFYISGYCYWPYPDDTTHFFLRPLFIGIDSLFEEQWIIPFAPLDSVFGFAFNTTSINDSVLMGVGYRMGDYNKNSILMFYNTEGEELGYNQISNEAIGPNVDFNAIREIVRVNDSLYLSPFYIGIGGETYFGEFVIDTSAAIHKQEIRDTYAGSSSIIKTSDDNYVIEIEVEEPSTNTDIYVYKIDENLEDVPFDPTPHNYDTLCPGGIQSGTIDLSDCFVWTDIGEAPSPKEYYESIRKIPVKAYPNPATQGTITFEYQNSEHHNNMELKCFGIYGKEIHSEKVYRYQGKSIMDISQWQNGMYVAVVYSEGLPVGSCKFVVDH